MKLAISNIAWKHLDDINMLAVLRKHNIQYLEIAPTRLFDCPYESSDQQLKEIFHQFQNLGISIISMQSILFGQTEAIFKSDESVRHYLGLFVEIFNFAKQLHIPVMVFGSPSIRNVDTDLEFERAVRFFSQLAIKARQYQVNIALEPNPKLYNTNFLNNTLDAIEFVQRINDPYLGINLDLGTIIYNLENLESLITEKYSQWIKHVHISEPNLLKIDPNHQFLHTQIIKLLNKIHYQNSVSIEMKSGLSLDEIDAVLGYIRDVYKDAGVINE